MWHFKGGNSVKVRTHAMPESHSLNNNELRQYEVSIHKGK
jgi:hypothetical protein